MKKNFFILTAVFALLAFLISCGGSEGSGNGGQGGSGETGSIYGVVSDRATGELIRKASVELKDSGSRTVGSYDTGSDGQFDFNELTSGTYTLYVT
ncbi:carboxypeptidase regulatory-like domain-containing protein, partial [bacterium]|nr:carboxypeptidase regulatory-like domain-containing protein [bacterium]